MNEVAGNIAVKHFQTDLSIEPLINKWLEENPEIEVIDIKFTATMSEQNWGNDVLIIYRKG